MGIKKYIKVIEPLMDLNILGITLGPLLFPRQALTEATRRLIEATNSLQRRDNENTQLKHTNDELVLRLHRSEQKLMQVSWEFEC